MEPTNLESLDNGEEGIRVYGSYALDDRAGQPSTGLIEVPGISIGPYLFASLLFLSFFVFGAAFAAPPPVPPCKPNQTTPPVGTRDFICLNWDLTFAHTWFCDAKADGTQNGLWWRYGYGDATVRNLTVSAATAVLSTYKQSLAVMQSETDTQLATRWNITFKDQTVDVCDPTSPDFAACATYKSCGVPNFYPPSGLRTHAEWPTAYKKREIPNGFQMVAIGTVPANVFCDTAQKAGDYFAIVDRDKAKMASAFAIKPTTVYARCQ